MLLPELTAHTIIIGYAIGMLWTFLSWTRTIHETYTRSKTAAERRDRNLARTLEASSRDTFAEGLLCFVWPVLVIRNLRSVVVVGKTWRKRRVDEKNR